MQSTKYIWQNGSLVNWDDAKTHVLSHSLHYGGSAFEGIRLYKTAQGSAVFRLQDHIDRLFHSAAAIAMKIPFTVSELVDAVKELLVANELQQGYIRPIAYYGYGKMGVNPVGAKVEVAISCWDWGLYLPYEMVDVQTSQYIRIPPQATVANAKLAGNYLNGILAILALQGSAYHEALFLDSNGFIAEGPGENFFIVKDNILYTPRLGAILGGLTRDTVFQIANKMGVKVFEKDIALDEAYQADEAFFTGTAAEVAPIKSIDDRVIGKGVIGPVTAQIKNAYQDVVLGRNKDFQKYLTHI